MHKNISFCRILFFIYNVYLANYIYLSNINNLRFSLFLILHGGVKITALLVLVFKITIPLPFLILNIVHYQIINTHFNTSTNKQWHKTVSPFHSHQVVLTVQFTHCNGLWIKHILVDRNIEGMGHFLSVQLFQSLSQDLKQK